MTPRLAIDWLGPLPPSASGIADYSAEILEVLARQHDVRIVTDFFAPHEAAEESTPYAAFTPDESRVRVYQIGNHHRFHGAAYEIALGHPGIVVLHEYGLWDLVRETALAKGSHAWQDELRYALGDGLPSFLNASEQLPSVLPPLFERLVDRSLGVIVHSETARRRVLASRPGARVWKVPHHFAAPPPTTAGRRELQIAGIDQDSFLVGVFGAVAPNKKIGLILDAFERLHDSEPKAHLLVVGEAVHADPALEARLADPPANVHVTGRVDLEYLQLAIETVDVGINLRSRSAGETSGTCIRLLGAGVPTIVSNTGWFSELADETCIKLLPDAYELATLQSWLIELSTRPALRAELGARAAAWVQREHSLDRTIAAYVSAIAEAAGLEPFVEEPMPPLLAYPGNRLEVRAAVELGAALADLAFDHPTIRTEGALALDREWLAEVAALSREIGLG